MDAGMLPEALEQMEYCYELTDENETMMVRDSDEVTLHHDVCVHLHRVYTKLAVKATEDGDPDTSVDYYLKAYNRAREGTTPTENLNINLGNMLTIGLCVHDIVYDGNKLVTELRLGRSLHRHIHVTFTVLNK